MKYWSVNMWDIICKDSTIEVDLGHKSFSYSEYIDSLETDHYDAAILFCQYEWEFNTTVWYDRIISITEKRNIKVYVIVGSSHNYENLPKHVQVICFPTIFFRHGILRYINVYKDFSPSNLFIENLDNLEYKYHFIYLNGVSHEWRSILIDKIAEHDLLKYSAYSWHSKTYSQTPYTFKYFDGIKKTLDENFSILSQGEGQIPAEYYQSFFQIIPESSVNIKFITEKTVLPLLIGKPFLIAGAPRIHKLLQDLGFKLYDEIFDYSFDDIEDLDQRFFAICNNIKNITNMSFEQCKEFHNKIQHKIIHNRNRAIELAINRDNLPDLIKEVISHDELNEQKIDERLFKDERKIIILKSKLAKNYIFL